MTRAGARAADYKSWPMTGFFTLRLAIFLGIAIFFLIVCPMTGFFTFFLFFFACFFGFDTDFAMTILRGYGVWISWISRIFT